MRRARDCSSAGEWKARTLAAPPLTPQTEIRQSPRWPKCRSVRIAPASAESPRARRAGSGDTPAGWLVVTNAPVELKIQRKDKSTEPGPAGVGSACVGLAGQFISLCLALARVADCLWNYLIGRAWQVAARAPEIIPKGPGDTEPKSQQRIRAQIQPVAAALPIRLQDIGHRGKVPRYFRRSAENGPSRQPSIR